MPTIGELAPDFELENDTGKPVKLSDFRGYCEAVNCHTFGVIGSITGSEVNRTGGINSNNGIVNNRRQKPRANGQGCGR